MTISNIRDTQVSLLALNNDRARASFLILIHSSDSIGNDIFCKPVKLYVFISFHWYLVLVLNQPIIINFSFNLRKPEESHNTAMAH